MTTEEGVAIFMQLVTSARRLKSEKGLKHSDRVSVKVVSDDPRIVELLKVTGHALASLPGLEEPIEVVSTSTPRSPGEVDDWMTIRITTETQP